MFDEEVNKILGFNDPIKRKNIRQWLLDNCVNNYGDLDLRGLDFTDFPGRILLDDLKADNDVSFNNIHTKRNLHQNGQVVNGILFQDSQKVRKHLFQGNQQVEGNLYQNNLNVKGSIFQNSKRGRKERPMPKSFTKVYNQLTYDQLCDIYRCSKTTIVKWKRELENGD